MLPAGYEPTIPASEWPQTHALDRATTGIDRNSPLRFAFIDVSQSTVDDNASSYTVASNDTSQLILQIAWRGAIYFHSSEIRQEWSHQC
jgi:hypothetical protein